MGHHELIEALRRDGESKCAAIVAEYEAEAERLRSGAKSRCAALRKEHERHLEALCRIRYRELVGAAEKEGRMVRLRAEYRLSERLKQRAVASLEKLRGEGYEPFFRKLAASLTWGEWGRIAVNPSDVAIAARMFPAAEIVSDGTITGGLRVFSADNELVVDCTLASRLERLWPDLLPAVFSGLRGELNATPP